MGRQRAVDLSVEPGAEGADPADEPNLDRIFDDDGRIGERLLTTVADVNETVQIRGGRLYRLGARARRTPLRELDMMHVM